MSSQHQRLKEQTQRQTVEQIYQGSLSTQMQRRKEYENPRKSYTTLICLILLCLAVVVTVNYKFYLQVQRTFRQDQAKAITRQQQGLLTVQKETMAKLKALQDHQSKISNQIGEIKSQLHEINQQILKAQLHATNQMSQLIDLIKKPLVEQEKGERIKVKALDQDARSFEADFLTQDDLNRQQFNSESEIYVDQTHIFDVPKKLWIFKETNRDYLKELCFKNNIDFAKQSAFEFVQIERANFKNYVPKKTAESIEKLLQILQKRVEIDSSNLKYHLNGITKTIILLNILNENGGLITDGEFAMTENLNWLKDIAANPYVNRGNRVTKPQIVGFYSPDYSFAKGKQNIKPFTGMQQVDKFITLFPALQGYFISAYSNTEFITRLIKTISKLLKNPASFKAQRGHYRLNNLKGQDIYYQYFLIAVQVVLQDKQKQIDSVKIDSYRHFAIDYYGLNLMNCFYAPYKLKVFWGDGQSNKAFQSLSQYSWQELQANIGPMRYMAKITPTREMNSYLQDTKLGKKKLILEGSFIHKIFFSYDKFNFIRANPEKSFVNSTNALWTTLPKIIWVFWDKGLANAGVNNQICVQNLRRMGALSGFKVNQVNLSNIAEYIDGSTLKKIQNSLANAKLKTYPQSKSDLYRLALLQKHGGIYMDASYIALQNFEWLINIGRYPSKYIFNRFGELPKVFMMWHPHYGAPLEWTINQRYNIKSQWHLAYENNLIVAEKDSQLVKEWFDLLLELYVKPYSEVEKVFQDCIMYSNKWSTYNWHYLIPMDTIKCVIGRRQVMISRDAAKKWQSASDYYKIWSMSGYLGQQKFRSNTNFQNHESQDNLFVYRYSQQYVQGLIGKVRHLVKFYSQHNKQLTLFVSRHMDGNFTSEAHSQSIFMRYMWNHNFRLEEVNFYPKLKVLS